MNSYEIFMEDALEEAYDEMNKYYREAGMDKEGVYKENYYFKNNLQLPFITPKLKQKSTREALIDFTVKFMNDHQKELTTAGPVYIFSFSEKHKQVLYDMFGLSGQKIVELYTNMINETFYGKISPFITTWVKNAPHKILLTCILIDGLQNGYNDIVECAEYLWGFAIYPIFYRKYWRVTVREDVMNYTIENLSKKYCVKNVNNLQELLFYDAQAAVRNKEDELKAGVDHAYTNFMRSIDTRVNNKFKNISDAYFKNIKNNATSHQNTTIYDDGTQVADQSGHTAIMAKNIDKTINKFATGEISKSYIKIAANATDTDAGNLAGFITQIYTIKDNKIKEFITAVITNYFDKNQNATSVGNTDFLNYGLALYRSIGTSKDENLIIVKKILAYWMNDIIGIGKYYNRIATRINYNRAVFNYMILMIHYYNN